MNLARSVHRIDGHPLIAMSVQEKTRRRHVGPVVLHRLDRRNQCRNGGDCGASGAHEIRSARGYRLDQLWEVLNLLPLVLPVRTPKEDALSVLAAWFTTTCHCAAPGWRYEHHVSQSNEEATGKDQWIDRRLDPRNI